MINKQLLENFLLIPQKDFVFEQKIDSSYIWDILKYKYESDLYFLSMLGIHIK